jgi:D-alanyl-D-alanine dipeptidase
MPVLGLFAALLGAVLAPVVCAADPAVAPPENARLARYVGEFAGGRDTVTVGEDHGRLFALHAHRGQRQWLTPTVNFPAAPDRLRLGRVTYHRTDIGAVRLAQIHAGVKTSIDALRSAALAAQPPVEPPHRARSDLVDLTTIDPTIRLDIRYATPDNIIGQPLYEKPMAFLQRPAAMALGRANRALAAYGYGLLIHDGYRPWYVTRMFWDATAPDEHRFVADPAEGSRHNRGCAVDLTLYDLKTGQAVVMTGRYDEMSPRSFADYPGGTTRQRWLRALLRRVMEAQGFTVYSDEWWHFDYRTWADYPIGNARFSDLGSH